jgi:ribosomal protein S18 acetylase RimI-like enzyme
VRRLPDEYALREGPPDVDAYLDLRERAGLSVRRADQARGALAGSWYAVHVLARATGVAVGMGRVIGDGGWYFHIADMAVLPEHQRRGIGDAILTALLARIRTKAPPGAFVSLLADEPGRPLYRRHGFTETGPRSIAMALLLGDCESDRHPDRGGAGDSSLSG